MLSKTRFILVTLSALMAITAIFSAPVFALTAYPGETISLSGGASGTDYVYLFLTGPNLASNGVSPEDLSTAVVTGDSSTFTRVSVGNNNKWDYKWDTVFSGGSLDTGTYVMYAVNTPSGKNDLSGKEFSYTVITLSDPTISAYVSTESKEKTKTPSPLETEDRILTADETEKEVFIEDTNKSQITPVAQKTQESGGFMGFLLLLVAVSFALVVLTKSKKV